MLNGGGGGGIRTHGTLARTTVFEFDVSRDASCCYVLTRPNSLSFFDSPFHLMLGITGEFQRVRLQIGLQI